MRRSSTVPLVAAGLAAVLALSGCGGVGSGIGPSADAEVVADDQAAADDEAVTDGEAAYPVTAEYAGLTWSVTGVDTDPEGYEDEWLLADLQVTNNTPIGVALPVSVLSLQVAGGETLAADSLEDGSLDIGSGDTAEVSVWFADDSDPDVAALSLVVGEEGRIPEVVPFAGGAADKPYPVDATFTGSDNARDQTAIGTNVDTWVTITALGATVTLDALGWRAPVGGRLLVLDVRLEVRADSYLSANGPGEYFRLDVDGTPRAPIYTHYPSGTDDIEQGAAGEFTLVFEIPTDVTELELTYPLVDNPVDDPAQIPVEVGELPPCCGE